MITGSAPIATSSLRRTPPTPGKVDEDLVHLLPRASFSNAAGKQIGNAAIYSHTNFLFNKWVLANSTPNGRTKEGHGAMRFLDPVLDMIAPSIGGLDRR